MLNLKKTAVAVLALGSSAVFAGTMGPVCTPGNVTVPCERTAWDFGVQALYLQPTNDFYTSHIRVEREGRDGIEVRDHFNSLDNDWGWGFKLEGSYHFNTGNDLNINWYHYNKTTNRRVNALTVDAFGEDLALRLATSAEPRWDAVNFELGQHVDFSEQKKIRFHGGAQYARIKHNFDAGLARRDRDGDDDRGRRRNFFDANTEFNGFGPRVGMDMSYFLGNGFAVYAKGATALLIGDSSFNVRLRPINDLGIRLNGSKTTMVPELEGKLGATYTHSMAQGDLSLDAGYLWVNYFNPQHAPGLLNLASGGIANSNFGIQGVFAGVKWVGNV
jgi:hypothetical protein